jgi:acetyl-CoA C-acetyltransferase
MTAGNASGINDGAASAIVISKEKAKELGVKTLMRLLVLGGASLCVSGGQVMTSLWTREI